MKSELEYLRFLLNNRLNNKYSISDLRAEVRKRIRKIGKGCGQWATMKGKYTDIQIPCGEANVLCKPCQKYYANESNGGKK